MSNDDREKIAREIVEELTERRENRTHGFHNVAIAAFNDANRTLSVMQREVCNHFIHCV